MLKDLRAATVAIVAFAIVLSIVVLVAFVVRPNPDYSHHTDAASASP